MGSFLFKWEHPASDVYVTGTFDDWSKSEKLEKKGDVFEKNVTLSDASEKIYYKFVVDGNWVTDHTAPQENDYSGNLNNVLTTDRIIKHTPATAGIMSSVGPQSTTAKLAGEQPLEKTGSSDLPGSFPETPAAEQQTFSVDPIPATAGSGNPVKLAAGEPVPHHSNFTSNTVSSTVEEDRSLPDTQQTFGVAPIAATAVAGNPIKLAAGESVPHQSNFTANTVSSTATTDKASYENADGSAPVLPPVVTPAAERASKGTGVLDLPPISGTMIPESSLPMGASGVGSYDASPMISSAGANSTTAALAGQVPLEPSARVPAVVKESQHEAGVSPEASAVASEVAEKSAVEKELLSEVSKAPVTSDGTPSHSENPEKVVIAEKSAVEKELLSEVPKASVTSDGTVLHSEAPLKVATGVSAGEAAAAVGAAAVAVGGAATAAAYAAGNTAKSYLPASIQNSITDMNAQSSAKQSVAGTVPNEVKKSLAESGQSPEAAAYSEPVAEKSAVEKQLLSEIKPEQSTGESAPKTSAVATSSTSKDTSEKVKADLTPAPLPSASESKSAIPSKVDDVPVKATNNPAPIPATPTKLATTAPSRFQSDSRDVSPGTVPGSHSQTAPVVTSGVQSATTAAHSTPSKAIPVTPTKGTPSSTRPAESSASSTPASDKKKKRQSFFGKLKEKLSSKN